MKISIITINYNNADGLNDTVNSVLSQTYKNIEYIIIDGGSEDESKNIILKNEERISYWVSESDRGIYNAMNKGIKVASGEYLLFLNSGDILSDKNIIESVLPFLQADIVFGNLIQYFSETKSSVCNYPDQIDFSYLFDQYLPHPSTFFKAKTFKKVGNYNEEYSIVADWAFFLKALAKYNVTYLHAPLIISIYNMGGISSKPENLFQIQNERELFLKEEFGMFYNDYVELRKVKDKLASLKKSKAYKLLKFIGIKKFD